MPKWALATVRTACAVTATPKPCRQQQRQLQRTGGGRGQRLQGGRLLPPLRDLRGEAGNVAALALLRLLPQLELLVLGQQALLVFLRGAAAVRYGTVRLQWLPLTAARHVGGPAARTRHRSAAAGTQALPSPSPSRPPHSSKGTGRTSVRFCSTASSTGPTASSATSEGTLPPGAPRAGAAGGGVAGSPIFVFSMWLQVRMR